MCLIILRHHALKGEDVWWFYQQLKYFIFTISGESWFNSKGYSISRKNKFLSGFAQKRKVIRWPVLVKLNNISEFPWNYFQNSHPSNLWTTNSVFFSSFFGLCLMLENWCWNTVKRLFTFKHYLKIGKYIFTAKQGRSIVFLTYSKNEFWRK